jgi:predicted nucleic acid-binding protein
MVVVDSNVILDVITADPRWQAWSEAQLCGWLNRGPVLINPIVYAEIAFATETIEAVEELLPAHLYTYRPIPREAAFFTAKAHAHCRAQGGSRQSVLADFLNGAHGLVEGVPLLICDPRRYQPGFPRPGVPQQLSWPAKGLDARHRHAKIGQQYERCAKMSGKIQASPH